jgi:hypothetical protein
MIRGYIWRIVAAIATLVSTYTAIAIRRRRSFRLLTSTGNAVIRLDEPLLKTDVEGKHLKHASISIECPQLQLPHSNVLGTDEELEIVFKLLDENGQPIIGRATRISVEDSEIGRFASDNQGMYKIEHVFNNKGTYNISCRFEGDEVYASCGHQITIRIVDYRQEVACLFNTMKKSAMSSGAIIKDQSTTRDVAATLLGTFTDMDGEKLDKFIYHVEESLYSSHCFDSERYSDTLRNYPGNSISISLQGGRP